MNMRLIQLAVVGLCSFAGGFAAQYTMGQAIAVGNAGVHTLSDSGTAMHQYSDDAGRSRVDIGVMHGSPMQDFYGEDGQLRLQMGTYSAAGEAGLPLVGLSGNHTNLKMLLRLAGSNESPVLIMKDNQQRDRIVLGLDLSGSGQEPFMAYFDQGGGKHMVFGNY